LKKTIRFTLNGRAAEVAVGKGRTLLWVLRTELGLTGTKYGCGKSLCGACTVLLDEKAVSSCRTAVEDVAGRSVVTIEGLARDGKLHPIQEAFVAHDALQCGFCTPGMILTALDLLHRKPKPSREEIIAHMDDNLCRCGAHTRIIDAILAASKDTKGAALP
jgi:aerobic-type carbon monoxide dehydrogenase small subunit (CoxS/CutS family)